MGTNVDVVNTSNEKVDSLELPEAIFGVAAKPHLLHEVVRMQLANRRQRIPNRQHAPTDRRLQSTRDLLVERHGAAAVHVGKPAKDEPRRTVLRHNGRPCPSTAAEQNGTPSDHPAGVANPTETAQVALAVRSTSTPSHPRLSPAIMIFTSPSRRA